MKPIGFEKRTDGCWWILEDKDGAVSRRSMSPLQYDQAVADLVAYLQWMGEPAQNDRVRIGVWVLMFLVVFTIIAWRLNASFWKDIR